MAPSPASCSAPQGSSDVFRARRLPPRRHRRPDQRFPDPLGPGHWLRSARPSSRRAPHADGRARCRDRSHCHHHSGQQMKSQRFRRRIAGLFISALIMAHRRSRNSASMCAMPTSAPSSRMPPRPPGAPSSSTAACRGKVSVVTDRPSASRKYFEIFLSTLRAQRPRRRAFVGRLLPHPARRRRRHAAQRRGPRGQSHSFVTEVIRLKSIDPQSAMDTIRRW